MPRPTSSTTVNRPDLQAVVFEFNDNMSGFIGGLILPDFPVLRQSAEYPVIPIEALLEAPDDISRRPRGTYKRGDFEFETDNYSCVENAWEEPVDDVEVNLYGRYFDVEKIAAMRARAIVQRVREKRIAAMLFNTDNFDEVTITHEWDDPTNAVPITDVQKGRRVIHDACGLEPDTLIIAYSTFHNLSLCDQIINRIKYVDPRVQRGQLTTEHLAQVLEVNRVLVGDGMKNTANKGLAPSLSHIWDNEYAMLCVTSDSPDITQPSIGRTFRWVQDTPEAQVIESYREDQTRGDIIRVREHTDEEFILPACAYLMENITTAA